MRYLSSKNKPLIDLTEETRQERLERIEQELERLEDIVTILLMGAGDEHKNIRGA